MNFWKLLSKPEGKTLKFKRDLSSLKSILKTLVAFANTAGGTIIIGRSDGGKIGKEGHRRLKESRNN
jgi:predicted HTH transcriptional regulator